MNKTITHLSPPMASRHKRLEVVKLIEGTRRLVGLLLFVVHPQ